MTKLPFVLQYFSCNTKQCSVVYGYVLNNFLIFCNPIRSRVPKHFQCTWINAIDERRIWTLLFIWETTFSPKKCSAICRDSSVAASSDLQVHFSKIILHSFAIWWKIWTPIYFPERNRRKRMRTFSKSASSNFLFFFQTLFRLL